MGKDKILHLIVGIVMGLVLSLFSVVGLFLGWAVIIGWEVFQAGTGSGTPEVLEVITTLPVIRDVVTLSLN